MNKKEKENYLNGFFVDVFNKILIAEENFLNTSSFNNLSIKEIHILEAIYLLTEENKNTMGEIAKKIGITIGALTTAINVIINKGFITRQRNDIDRRIVKIYLTDLGEIAEKEHRQFHQEMISNITSVINDNELSTLIFSLEQLKNFFSQYLNNIKK